MAGFRVANTAYANSTTYYAYDGSGNTTSITSPVSGSLTAPGAINTRLGYNAAGWVNSITLKDGSSVTLTYNAQGQRASYSALSAMGQTLYSAQFTYSGGELSQASVVSATAGGGTVSYTDSYLDDGDGQPIEFARVQNGATSYYWYEYDGRGDVVSVTDSNGNVVDSYEYDLWGEEITDTSHEAVPQRLRAGAMWFDEEMQVQWLWDNGRYYDPELERYLQPGEGSSSSRLQPHVVGGDGGYNYAFASDNPAANPAKHCTAPSGGCNITLHFEPLTDCPDNINSGGDIVNSFACTLDSLQDKRRPVNQHQIASTNGHNSAFHGPAGLLTKALRGAYVIRQRVYSTTDIYCLPMTVLHLRLVLPVNGLCFTKLRRSIRRAQIPHSLGA